MPRNKALRPSVAAVRNLALDDLLANVLLADLESSAADTILQHGVVVELIIGNQIYWAGTQIDDVYFPIDCIFSVVTATLDGGEMEVGTIGREGVSAIPLLLGGNESKNDVYCQVPGFAVKLSTTFFRILQSCPDARTRLDRYVQAYVSVLGQFGACNSLHTVHQRCARWLLMTQDRVGRPTFRLTHEFLAMMLGSRRAGVTIAAGALRKAGLIRYRNGEIFIANRAGLEAQACECYQAAREQFGGFRSAGDRSHRKKQQTVCAR